MMSDSDGGDLSDVDDFDDLEMIMQQVLSEQQQQEEGERVRHRNYIYRERLDAEARLMADYFGPHPKYPDNDLTVLSPSSLFDDLLDDIAPMAPFECNERRLRYLNGNKKVLEKTLKELLGSFKDVGILYPVGPKWRAMTCHRTPSSKRKEYGGGGGLPHPTWLRHRPRHHTTTARHCQKTNGGDLSDVHDFDDLEMIMQQVQSEQQQEEAKRVRHRNYIYRERLDAEARLMADYFVPHPKYPEYYFRKRYRMSCALFLKIGLAGANNDLTILNNSSLFDNLLDDITPWLRLNRRMRYLNGNKKMLEKTLKEILGSFKDVGILYVNRRMLGPSTSYAESCGGDLSDVDDFGDLEMIMQQVQSEQQQEEEA
uniref:Uncharacterized protein n=1 Tax=Tanacetum cinerariifolium TaxID=118510 RepID=A0A6L2N7Y0_TANCI|nr:hypothetical protein [Tanacetum cinerariifolium]